MTLTVVLSFVVTMILSAAMIPLIIKVGNQLGIVAHMNKRTVHKHEIARIGGYAIYISSLIGSMLFLKTDHLRNLIALRHLNREITPMIRIIRQVNFHPHGLICKLRQVVFLTQMSQDHFFQVIMQHPA